jgi:hypothetical protein
MPGLVLHAIYGLGVFVHAAAGVVGLVVMPLALVTRKGGRWHRRAGLVFAAAMAVAAITGVAIAAAWLLDVSLVKRLPEDPVRQAAAIAAHRVYGLFFLLLAILLAASVSGGVLSVWGRRSARAAALGPVVALGFGLALVSGGLTTTVTGLWVHAPLLVAFGLLGAASGVGELRIAARRSSPARAWMLRHAQGMLGAATAASTAFAVQMSGRMEGVASLLAWLVPVAIGTALTTWWSMRLGRRKAARVAQ